MKKLFTLMLSIMSLSAIGQETKIISENFPSYQGIVSTNLTANELYAASKMWIAENFKSANDVIQLDDKESSTIICKGITKYGSGFSEYRVHFTLKIEGKENRFRYTISVNDMRAGTQDISGMSMFKPDSKNAEKFDTSFMRPQISIWVKGILNTKTNSDDNW